MGRPSKLQPDLQERFCALVRAGNTVEIAAEAVGIGESTFYSWMDRGERGKPADRPYKAFREAVEQARGEAESILVARVAKAAQGGSWQAAAWLLERRAPERWGKPQDRKNLSANSDTPTEPPAKRSALDELAARRDARAS